MAGFFTHLISKTQRVLANRNNTTKVKYLKKKGARIGERTKLNCRVEAFGSEPYLVTIGEDCLFAADVRFITHDGGIGVLNNLGFFGDTHMDSIAPITVGNNVYIGTGAYIMAGVRIGNNVVIGAGAIVTRNISDNTVAVGVPAKPVESLDDYCKHIREKGKLFPTLGMPWDEKRKYYEQKFGRGQE